MSVFAIKKKHEKQLMKKANVIGCMTAYKVRGGVRTEELAVTCMVSKKISKSQLKTKDVIPKTIDGASTDVIEVGEVKALGLMEASADNEVDRKKKIRPAPMGVSGGHYNITAGTCGELLYVGGSMLSIGTNNHVAANSNEAKIGDPFLQPGPHDGGRNPEDIIGYLYGYKPISFIGVPSECPIAKMVVSVLNLFSRVLGRKTRLTSIYQNTSNLVDAAAVILKIDADAVTHILDIGVPCGTKTAVIDMHVQKSGRTTEHTLKGPITAIDATINVNYGGSRMAMFTDQIIISQPGFSAGGDSGSLILDMDNHAVGKLFAGSDQITIANHIDNYLTALDAEIVTT